MPVQKKTITYFAIELSLWKGGKFLKKLWKQKFFSLPCVLPKVQDFAYFAIKR